MSKESNNEAAPNFSLEGKKALITGAGRGIGLAAAKAMAAAGAHVVLVARSAGEIKAGAEAITKAGGKAEWAPLDIIDQERMTGLVREKGPFHILLNNAGTNRPASFEEVQTTDFDLVFLLNVKAAFFTAQAVARSMIEHKVKGSIIHLSSQMGLVGGKRRSVYCATKHALEGMNKAMALDLAPHGIRSNTLCPTFIETPLTKPFLADEAFMADVMSQIALGRVGQVEDLTGAIVFLASDASSLMTGSSLVVDGGWTAK